jgi:hypothetical protein
MKIELKAIKVFEAMTEETTAFYANVYIDGKHRGYAKDDGRGGCIDIRPEYSQDEAKWKANKQAMLEAEDYCKKLPPIKYRDMELANNLEMVVGELLSKFLDAKADKKFIKDMDKGLLFGRKENYTMVYWNNTTVVALLQNTIGRARIKKICAEKKAKGETLLNTNIPADLLN